MQMFLGVYSKPAKYLDRLHGPCLLPGKAKFTVRSIIKLATIAFDETSSYWSALKSS